MTARGGNACDIVVFGGTGDLAMRKLLPALYYLHRDRHLHPQTRILALARARHEPEAYRRLVRRHVSQHVASADFSEDSWGSFSARLDYMPLDISQRLEFARLARQDRKSTRLNSSHVRIS